MQAQCHPPSICTVQALLAANVVARQDPLVSGLGPAVKQTSSLCENSAEQHVSLIQHA